MLRLLRKIPLYLSKAPQPQGARKRGAADGVFISDRGLLAAGSLAAAHASTSAIKHSSASAGQPELLGILQVL
jgi:hypothetical protein